ncbi:hypothetical protein EA187_13770 [Lujinxingia sediminis]|uniref:Uncharacterized protein n=2 Tax=Lujinxingia sediminis TaxID=2480984 RepID=A0ABY0CR83_9DELT|nr:hypothetical protein EA187_13770 [Lujinxingia sediminis]
MRGVCSLFSYMKSRFFMKVQSRVAALGAALATTTLFAAPALASAPLLECPGGGYGTSLISSVQGGLDDGSAPISIAGVFPNGMDVLDTRFTNAWVNINGTITFKDPLATYTPDAIPGLSQPTIAPYFADVDFRPRLFQSRQGDMTFCEDPVNNRVLVTWKDVGYFNKKTNKLNSFQVVLKNTEGECADAETFDVEFRYNRLEWTTGDESGGSNGEGGTPAVAGIDAGDELSAEKLPGSGTAAVLDLVNQTNTGTPGVFEFRVAGWTMPECGDGNVDLCEECDGSAGCTPICTVSVCGDGFVEPGVEQCDGEAFAGGAASCPAGYTGTPLCNNDPNNALADGTCTVDAVPAGCVDVDECAETTGICGDASCVNTDGGYSCVCDAGYEFNGSTCVDVDECTETPGVCGAGTCSNTGGDYSCACDAGYEFDGTTCVNVDECSASAGVCGEGTCTDTDGAYTCTCDAGYEFNGSTCVDVNECTETPGICGAGTCSNTGGDYSCACDAGYEFDGTTCVNVDECAGNAGVCGSGTCTDTDGSYSCACEAGYEFNGTTCQDVNECTETPGICGEGRCINTGGSYSCNCTGGYEFVNGTCEDVDECAETPGICGEGTCTDTDGAYSCTCPAGYEFNGTTCVDVDECADTTTCGAGTCTNTDGGYSCGCPEGYVSNNGTCENVDECTENAGVCGAGTCSDTDGAYECACEEGYEFANGTCENVDECAQSTDTCSENATCTDTDGAYECGCEPGYAGNGEVCTVVVTIISPDTSFPVNNPTPTFEGTGEPGAVVELSVDGEVVGTATVDPDGEWTIVLDEPLEDGEYSVVVGDGSSTDEVTLVIDTLAPELEVTLPEQDVRYSNSPDAIEGQAEPGNQIDIVINGEHVGTTTADENGEFEFELDEALEDGVYEVIVSATDDAGNTTDEIVDFSVDGSAELQIETPEDESTVRTSTPTISGTAEPGTIVVVLIDGEEVAQVEADEEGEWTYTLEEALEDGEYDVVVQADSPSGTRQDQVEITVDTTTTDVTIEKPGTDVPTSEATPEFSGTAAPGATVTIIIDGEEVAEVEADPNGQWSYVPEDDLSEGEHTVTVIAEDEGIETEATVDFEVDLTPPTLEVTSPRGGSEWFGEPVVVEGEAEPGSVIVIEVDGEVVETIEVGEDGQWSTTLPGDVTEGEHVVTVRAEDPAGNTTEEQRTFNVTYGELAGGSVLAGCASAPGTGGNGLWLVLAALGLVIGRRRRR